MSEPQLLVPVVLSEETLNTIMDMVSQVCQERGGGHWKGFERHVTGLIRQDIDQAGEDIAGYNSYVYREHTRVKTKGEGFPKSYSDQDRPMEPESAECPACAGEGQIFPGVDVNLWAGLGLDDFRPRPATCARGAGRLTPRWRQSGRQPSWAAMDEGDQKVTD